LPALGDVGLASPSLPALKRRTTSFGDLDLPMSSEELAAEKAAKKLAAEKLAAEKVAAEELAAEKVAAEELAAGKAAKKLAAEKLAAGASEENKAGQLMDLIIARDAERAQANKEAAAEKRAAKKVAEQMEKLVASKLAADGAVTPKKKSPIPLMSTSVEKKATAKVGKSVAAKAESSPTLQAAETKLKTAKSAAKAKGSKAKVDHERTRHQYLCRPHGTPSTTIKYDPKCEVSQREACEKATAWCMTQL